MADLDELANLLSGADTVIVRQHMGLRVSEVLALVAENRSLRAMKLRVHELADPFAGGGSKTMDEIERITR